MYHAPLVHQAALNCYKASWTKTTPLSTTPAAVVPAGDDAYTCLDYEGFVSMHSSCTEFCFTERNTAGQIEASQELNAAPLTV